MRRSRQIFARLPEDVIRQVQLFAEQEEVTRDEAVRRLLVRGLAGESLAVSGPDTERDEKIESRLATLENLINEAGPAAAGSDLGRIKTALGAVTDQASALEKRVEALEHSTRPAAHSVDHSHARREDRSREQFADRPGQGLPVRSAEEIRRNDDAVVLEFPTEDGR